MKTNIRLINVTVGERTIEIVEGNSEDVVVTILTLMLGMVMVMASGASEDEEFTSLSANLEATELTDNGEIAIAMPNDFGAALNDYLTAGFGDLLAGIDIGVNYVEAETSGMLDFVFIEKPKEDLEEGDEPL